MLQQIARNNLARCAENPLKRQYNICTIRYRIARKPNLEFKKPIVSAGECYDGRTGVSLNVYCIGNRAVFQKGNTNNNNKKKILFNRLSQYETNTNGVWYNTVVVMVNTINEWATAMRFPLRPAPVEMRSGCFVFPILDIGLRQDGVFYAHRVPLHSVVITLKRGVRNTEILI